MRCLIMPRSQCENENVQFVQELAEVDGPFESPININYRDLTKLELPSLCWHRSETCPQKMKITNTGHTVIISGKWKCERPYLTGGPLTGKYVFSQIHFHWGQDECKGSEHQVCGEGFPLEMHVAHFKTDYLSQENALKEKDGMIVVAYLFKLQTEPNPALKKILSLLPCVQQPCTSRAFEPRPLMSLLNPFTDDYFMYWGSVITPTCAHILLWIICREPFGISREQVEEFRKILDSSQHPICRNSRDVQPLHKRNVFHVNASRELDSPLLPVKQMLGCYCKGSEENISFKSINSEEPPGTECSCPVYLRNQEEIEGTAADDINCPSVCPSMRGTSKWNSTLPGNAYLNQYVYVHNAIIASSPILAKKFESELIKKNHYPLRKQIKSEDNVRTNFISRSCCFFPIEKINQIKPRPKRRKNREKKKSNSFRTFTNILNSLEALKNHTFKKLKEIDAINQEITGLKSFCNNAEDKRWLRRIEKVMTSQKQFTIKKSRNCFGELKKLARECNFDKLFDNKQFSTSSNYQKIIQLKNTGNRNANPALPCPDAYKKKAEVADNLAINQATKFSLKAQKLIQSFFEDIKDNEDSLQKTVQKNLLLKKIESVDNKEAGDSTTVSKGYITQKMFNTENLGDRFFTEVTTEVDTEEEKVEEVIITVEESADYQESEKSEKKYFIREVASNKKDSGISLHKATELPKRNDFENQSVDTETQIPNLSSLNDTGTTSDDENLMKSFMGKKLKKKNVLKKPLESYLKKLNELTKEKFQTELKTDENLARMWYSNSNLLTDSTETQSMLIAKFHKSQSKGDLWKRKSLITKMSSKKVIDKSHCKTKLKNCFEGHHLKKKKRSKNTVIMSSCDLSSTSGESVEIANKSKSKRLVKAQLKLAIEKLVKSGSSESEVECKIISPKRKMLKLDNKKKNVTPTEYMSPETSGEMLTDECVQAVAQNTDAANEENAFDQTMGEKERVLESVVLVVEDEPLEKYREAITQTATSRIEMTSTKGQQCDSKTKIFRTASAESNHLIKLIKTPQEDEELIKMTEQIPKTRIKKLLVKNKSLASLINSPRFFSTKTPQRLFVENIDSRRKCSKDPSDLEKIANPRVVVESPKKVQETLKEPEEVQTESIRNLKMTIPGAKQNISEVKCEADFSKTTVKQVEEELKLSNQIQREKSKIPLVRKRYGFSGKQRKEVESTKQKQIEDKPQDYQPGKPKKPVTNSNVKVGDDSEIKEKAQTSAFLTNPKKSSAESVNSHSKPLKRKTKKRPSINKRSSKHIIRKNSLRTRKPNKVESKSLEEKCAPDKEQLKNTTDDVGVSEQKPDAEKNIDKEIKEAAFESLKTAEGNVKETPVKKLKVVKEKEAKQGLTRLNKKPEQKIPQPKQTTAPPEIPKEKPASPKPTNDFIKRNKQMAGKYKRGPSPTEKPTEVKPAEFKSIQTNKKIVNAPTKERKEIRMDQPQLDSGKVDNSSGNVVEVKEKRTKIPKSVGKPEKFQERPESSETKGVSSANQEESENLCCISSEVALQKIPQPNTRFLPAYMMTSDLPPPMEIVQNQQKQMNRYMLNADLDYAPEMLKENLKKDKNCDFLYKKDLEYLLTLQRCLYGDMSTSIENSMNYVKTLLSQEYNGTTVLGDPSTNDSFDCYEPLHYSDSCNSGIVLIEMSDFLDSSTSNSDLSGYFKLRQLDSLTQQLKNKIYISKVPQDSGDPGIVNPIISPSSQEEWHTDSNYDCQIFITLSANSNETEGGTPSLSATEEICSGIQEVTTQSYTYLERNNPQLTLKQQRKKRKENEISADMKQKLLEILETEIKREIGVECSNITIEAANERHTSLILEESESNQRSRSIGSFDNMEVLKEISETMREYLTNLKETKVPQRMEDAE